MRITRIAYSYVGQNAFSNLACKDPYGRDLIEKQKEILKQRKAEYAKIEDKESKRAKILARIIKDTKELIERTIWQKNTPRPYGL